ncbi:MAG: spermidine synthase [Wenzhouxiangellaceae bacterium]
MPRSKLLATARIPDTETELKLHEHRDRFAISIPGRGELMNTRVYGSEIVLAEQALQRAPERKDQRVLIGGLGMGFTLAAALSKAGHDAEFVVAELVPEVVDWNRDLVGEPSGHPMRDRRVRVHVGDVAEVLHAPGPGFDAILMDVDNGPEGLIRAKNDWLYGHAGLEIARAALRPGGVLAVWSATPDHGFTKRLEASGFQVETQTVRPHRAGRGARHHLWFAKTTL